MNMKINNLLIVFVLATISLTGISQTTNTVATLTLSQAVAMAMKQNQDILIARNNLRIAENNSSLLN